MITRAPGQNVFTIKIKGKAAHAGINPEDGISAIKVATDIVRNLNLGRLDDLSTANIGMIRGGSATILYVLM